MCNVSRNSIFGVITVWRTSTIGRSIGLHCHSSTLAGRFCNLKNKNKNHFHGRKKRNTTNTVNKNEEKCHHESKIGPFSAAVEVLPKLL